jgi:hypothetical protein
MLVIHLAAIDYPYRAKGSANGRRVTGSIATLGATRRLSRGPGIAMDAEHKVFFWHSFPRMKSGGRRQTISMSFGGYKLAIRWLVNR